MSDARFDAAENVTPSPVRVTLHNGVAAVSVEKPSTAAIDPDVQRALCDVFDRIEDDAQVAAVVLRSAGGSFVAGLDSGAAPERAGATSGAGLSALCDRIEECSRPVVAVIEKTALGGGAALALAAHYRIAAQDAVIGLPEITLGLIPVAGATQRLARLVGAGAALDLMLWRHEVSAPQAEAMGLVDIAIGGDVVAGAMAYAQGLIDEGLGRRPARAMRHHTADGAAWLHGVAMARAAPVSGAPHAAEKIVGCVEAALLMPFAAGLAFEQDALAACRAHSESDALRHIFHAERRVDPALLKHESGGFLPVAPAGEAAVGQLLDALDRAIVWLVGAGITEREVDRAMLAHGYARGPFGHRPGEIAQASDRDDLALNDAIARRCLGALVAQGARLLEAGAVARASDVDALAVHGLGFARWRGGPMKAAQSARLDALHADLIVWAADDPVWTPPHLLSKAARHPDGFDAMP